jgi:predicted RNA binding protein YcfA (HicA-like mRNA interferase family)
VKLKDLERKLKDLGFWEVVGGKHAKWTNGVDSMAVPRHKEIQEYTARGIIKNAEAMNKKKQGGN